MSGLSAGWLDRDIVLQTATRQQSESGEVSYDWTTATAETLYAQWVPAGSREALTAQRQIESTISGAYKIQYRPEPMPHDSRIIGHDGRIYDIMPATEIGRQEGWLIPVVARGEL